MKHLEHKFDIVWKDYLRYSLKSNSLKQDGKTHVGIPRITFAQKLNVNLLNHVDHKPEIISE